MGSAPATIPVALEMSRQLKILLEEEFSSLVADNLDQFEKLALAKSEIIAKLADFIGESGQAGDSWREFRDEMNSCKTLHRRNETLLRAKLQSIQSALHMLQTTAENDGSSELYDRLGRVAVTNKRRRLADV